MTGDGDGDPESGDDVPPDLWDAAGRHAVGTLLYSAREDVDTELRRIADGLRRGEDPTPEDVREVRMRLNWLRVAVEDYLAPAAGIDKWGEPIPHTPYGARRGACECPGDESGGDGGR